MQCTNPLWIEKISLTVPCGKCRMCRIAKAREWSTRILHECGYHENSVFVTLTYDDDHLPSDGSISKKELQRFFKRLRKQYSDRKIKYYACGEYGEQTNRPHYHAIIFGLGIKDFKITSNKGKLVQYTTAWKLGHIHLGTVTYDSARYVADYVQKKYSEDYENNPYKGLQQPFQLVSQGLGKQFALDNQKYLIDKMGCTIKGVEVGLPRYYQKQLNISTEQLTINAMVNKEKYENEFIKRGYDIEIEEGVYSGQLVDRIHELAKLKDLTVKTKHQNKKKKL